MRGAAWIVVASTLLGLVVLELGVRLTERNGCQPENPPVFARDPRYGWGHEPGFSGWAQQCIREELQWRTFIRIDHHGLRGRDIPYERSAAQRILVLGDSFVEGFQVDVEQTAVARVERALNAPAPPGTRVEVLNGGVSGWSTDNALEYFLAEGRRFHPDTVVLAFDTFNDVMESSRPLVTNMRAYPDKPYFALRDGRLVRTNSPLPTPPLAWRAAVALHRALAPYSALARRIGRVSTVWRYLQGVPSPPPEAIDAHPWQVYLRDYPEPWREAWRITRGLILRLRQAAAANGARFVVFVVNGREEVSPARMKTAVDLHPDLAAGVDPDKPNRLLVRFLQRRGIPVIAPLDEFRAAFGTDGRPGFYDADIHWTAAGHALAAERLARGLVDLGLVAPPRQSSSN